MVCALEVVCFAVFCCSVVAERLFALRIGCCLLRGLLLPSRGVSPFDSAHWMLLALQSLVARLWHIAILFCALDVVCFAVCCCSAVAERHFGLRIGCCLLCSLLLPGCGILPFYSAHWRLFASRSVVARWWHIAILFCALDILCFAIFCNSAIGGAPGVHEQQETCESSKHLMCKNNKRAASGVHELK